MAGAWWLRRRWKRTEDGSAQKMEAPFHLGSIAAAAHKLFFELCHLRAELCDNLLVARHVVVDVDHILRDLDLHTACGTLVQRRWYAEQCCRLERLLP